MSRTTPWEAEIPRQSHCDIYGQDVLAMGERVIARHLPLLPFGFGLGFLHDL